MLLVLNIVFYLHVNSQRGWFIFSFFLFVWFITVVFESAEGMIPLTVSKIMFFFAFIWLLFYIRFYLLKKRINLFFPTSSTSHFMFLTMITNNNANVFFFHPLDQFEIIVLFFYWPGIVMPVGPAVVTNLTIILMLNVLLFRILFGMVFVRIFSKIWKYLCIICKFFDKLGIIDIALIISNTLLFTSILYNVNIITFDVFVEVIMLGALFFYVFCIILTFKSLAKWLVSYRKIIYLGVFFFLFVIFTLRFLGLFLTVLIWCLRCLTTLVVNFVIIPVLLFFFL